MNPRLLNILGLSLLLAGVLMILNLLNLTSIKEPTIAAAAMILFGLSSILFNRSVNRAYIFISGVIFMIGIILFVINQYEILQSSALFLPSFFVVLGSGSLMLYIDNTKEYVFLFSAAGLLLFGYLTATGLKDNSLVRFTNEIGMTIITYWPFVALLAGLYYLLKMNKKKS